MIQPVALLTVSIFTLSASVQAAPVPAVSPASAIPAPPYLEPLPFHLEPSLGKVEPVFDLQSGGNIPSQTAPEVGGALGVFRGNPSRSHLHRRARALLAGEAFGWHLSGGRRLGPSFGEGRSLGLSHEAEVPDVFLTWVGDKVVEITFDGLAYGLLPQPAIDRLRRLVVTNVSSLHRGQDFSAWISSAQHRRSLLLAFTQPALDIADIGGISVFQVKGNAFDSGKLSVDFDLDEARVQVGLTQKSDPTFDIDAAPDGKLSAISDERTPIGALGLEEARREFYMHRFFLRHGFRVSYPVAFGAYPEEDPGRGRKLGFVILGQRPPIDSPLEAGEKLYPERLDQWINGAIEGYVAMLQASRDLGNRPDSELNPQELSFKHSPVEAHHETFKSVVTALAFQAGQLLRQIHDPNPAGGWPGAFHGSYSWGNLSTVNGAELAVHDLTDARSKADLTLPQIFAFQMRDFRRAAAGVLDVQFSLKSRAAPRVKSETGEDMPDIDAASPFLYGYFHDLTETGVFKAVLREGFFLDSTGRFFMDRFTQSALDRDVPYHKLTAPLIRLMRQVVGINRYGRPVPQREDRSGGASLGNGPEALWGRYGNSLPAIKAVNGITGQMFSLDLARFFPAIYIQFLRPTAETDLKIFSPRSPGFLARLANTQFASSA